MRLEQRSSQHGLSLAALQTAVKRGSTAPCPALTALQESLANVRASLSKGSATSSCRLSRSGSAASSLSESTWSRTHSNAWVEQEQPKALQLIDNALWDSDEPPETQATTPGRASKPGSRTYLSSPDGRVPLVQEAALEPCSSLTGVPASAGSQSDQSPGAAGRAPPVSARCCIPYRLVH